MTSPPPERSIGWRWVGGGCPTTSEWPKGCAIALTQLVHPYSSPKPRSRPAAQPPLNLRRPGVAATKSVYWPTTD